MILTPEGDRAPIERSTYVSISAFIIDINANGTAIGFGQQAPDDDTGFYVNMKQVMRKEVLVEIDPYASAGTTDADLYDEITALGWENDVIV